jgi:hypothetical protein
VRRAALPEGEPMTGFSEAKARLIDDDSFELRIIPFGGPIESPYYAKGMDLDAEFFSERTDIKPSWFAARPVTWHHGDDALMGNDPIGKTDNLHMEDDGWWERYWLEAGTRRRALIDGIAAHGKLYGSSAPIGRFVKKNAKTGEIMVWPHAEATLTTAPQNTLSAPRGAKAILDDFAKASIAIDAGLRDLLIEADMLSADLLVAPAGSITRLDGVVAKAGREVSAANLDYLEVQLQAFSDLIDGLRSWSSGRRDKYTKEDAPDGI